MIVSFMVAGVLHTKKVVAAIEAVPDGEASPKLRRQTLDPFICYIAHVATVGFLGVVFVMTNKPSGGVAALIVVIGVLAGLGLAKLQLDAAAKQIG